MSAPFGAHTRRINSVFAAVHACLLLNSTLPVGAAPSPLSTFLQVQRSLRILGVSLTAAETQLLVSEIDANGDGEVGAPGCCLRCRQRQRSKGIESQRRAPACAETCCVTSPCLP